MHNFTHCFFQFCKFFLHNETAPVADHLFDRKHLMLLLNGLKEFFEDRLNVVKLCRTTHCSHESIQDNVKLMIFRCIQIDYWWCINYLLQNISNFVLIQTEFRVHFR
jgi:hypothetical protein